MYTEPLQKGVYSKMKEKAPQGPDSLLLEGTCASKRDHPLLELPSLQVYAFPL